MNKIKYTIIVITVILAGISTFGYSYYKLEQRVNLLTIDGAGPYILTGEVIDASMNAPIASSTDFAKAMYYDLPSVVQALNQAQEQQSSVENPQPVVK